MNNVPLRIFRWSEISASSRFPQHGSRSKMRSLLERVGFRLEPWQSPLRLSFLRFSSCNHFPAVNHFPLLFPPIFPADFICSPFASHSSSSADFPFRPVISFSCFSFLPRPPPRKFPLLPEFLVSGISGSAGEWGKAQGFLAAPFFSIFVWRSGVLKRIFLNLRSFVHPSVRQSFRASVQKHVAIKLFDFAQPDLRGSKEGPIIKFISRKKGRWVRGYCYLLSKRGNSFAEIATFISRNKVLNGVDTERLLPPVKVFFSRIHLLGRLCGDFSALSSATILSSPIFSLFISFCFFSLSHSPLSQPLLL